MWRVCKSSTIKHPGGSGGLCPLDQSETQARYPFSRIVCFCQIIPWNLPAMFFILFFYKTLIFYRHVLIMVVLHINGITQIHFNLVDSVWSGNVGILFVHNLKDGDHFVICFSVVHIICVQCMVHVKVKSIRILVVWVWGMGMLRVILNIEAGNYYSKSTFIVTVIKQEKLVFIWVIIWGYYHVFTKLFTGTRVSEDFQFCESDSRNTCNRKRLQGNASLCRYAITSESNPTG